MRARTTLYLTSGFPGFAVNLVMDDEFFKDFRQKAFTPDSIGGGALRQAVGAPTLYVELQRDDGQPVGVFTWRFHRVRFGESVGADKQRLLLQWYQLGLQALVSSTGLAAPEGWFEELTAPEPVGDHPIVSIPPDPTTIPKCQSAPAGLMVGPFFHDGSNCYNYACNVAGEDPGPALPGRGTASEIGLTPSNDDLRKACESDGLTFFQTLPSQCIDDFGHFVALINRPPTHKGYHFFRLNQNGTWSHKEGQEMARDTDDKQPQSVTIKSLSKADFAYPYEFVGYFFCPGNPSRVD